MAIREAKILIRDLATDVAAHPRAGFDHVARWWDDVARIGRLLEGEVRGRSAEVDALRLAQQAIVETALSARASDAVDTSRVHARLVALDFLIGRRERNDGSRLLARA